MHIEIWAGGGVDPCWYWHFKNKGRITANAEAFYSKANAIRAAKGVVRAVCKPMVSFTPMFRTTEKDGVTIITWS